MNREETVLERYLNDIKQYPMVSVEREKELARIIQDTTASAEAKQAAKEELVLGNLRLVVNVATKIFNRMQGYDDTNFTFMDLIQAGNIALMHAADLFLPEKDNKFVTYAHISIERKIMKAFKDSRFVRLPPDHFKHMHEIDELHEKYGEMEDKDIAKKMAIMEKTLKSVKMNRYSRVQLEDIDDTMERVDSGAMPVSEILHKQDVRNYVFSKIKELKPRYQEVLFYKFFSNREMTLEDIAKKLGVTREAIRMILAHSLCKIKNKIDTDNSSKSIRSKVKYKKGR